LQTADAQFNNDYVTSDILTGALKVTDMKMQDMNKKYFRL